MGVSQLPHSASTAEFISYKIWNVKIIMNRKLEESEMNRVTAWLPELQVRNGMFSHPRTSVLGIF
jgi:hypothetical protein